MINIPNQDWCSLLAEVCETEDISLLSTAYSYQSTDMYDTNRSVSSYATNFNNPCNIRFSDENHWIGQLGPTSDAFCTFASIPYGLRAFLRTLLTYIDKYNIVTIKDFTHRYAPAGDGDNDPDLYANYLYELFVNTCPFADGSADKGIDDIDLPSVFADPDQLFCFTSAVSYIETGYLPTIEDFITAYLTL